MVSNTTFPKFLKLVKTRAPASTLKKVVVVFSDRERLEGYLNPLRVQTRRAA